MPSIKRKSPRVRIDVTEIDQHQEYILCNGHPMMTAIDPIDRATFEEMWSVHGPRLLRAWIAEQPGTRPFGWWLCQHKRERPIVNRWFLEDVMRSQTEPGTCLSPPSAPYGFLHTQCYGGRDFRPFQQEEHDYLRERGLLELGEWERMQKKHAQWRASLTHLNQH